MRFFAPAGAVLALGATLPAATPADAAPFPTRYCAQYKGGAENCGFSSFAQCLAALSGNGGMCFVAPTQTQVLTVHTPRGSYRIIRDAIDGASRTRTTKSPASLPGFLYSRRAQITAPAGPRRVTSCRPVSA